MANVKVAIRVRPLNARESVDGGKLAVQVEENFVRIKNVKEVRLDGHSDGREKLLEFGFDYCYWSVDPADPRHASQEEVFQDLGVLVLSGASAGYNVCLFAYGQTGTGKTYTMMGTPDSMGLTPRICQGLFRTEGSFPDGQSSSRVQVSFLEIYNERVRDLLGGGDQKKRASLRVREHPEKGPYVQDLTQHTVSDYRRAVDLLEEGIANRITAATHIHDASSRSHAIFTIQYTQAILENNLPSEIVSKINLVDLAGSERANPHYCRDRLTEGSNINKSLVTLGIVISALAQNSQMSSSSQSINSMASEGEGSVMGSQASSLSGGAGAGGAGAGGGRRHCFIPYRDSVLTWLLKDSLGGNAKTIMMATVSPSCSSYSETLSTLRYAAHARNIVNKPRVNEDASVRLIRELRQEIDRLKSMLLSFQMRNPSPSLSDERDGNLSDIVLQNELKVEQLTKDWSESWQDKQDLLEQYSVDINRDKAGFLIQSLLPHLVTLDRDVLSTGVTFYHLREGVTLIGPQTPLEEPQTVLQGGATCEIENKGGVVTLRPLPGSVCMVNNREVTKPCRLAQGSVITLGGVHKFRFNHPEEAAVLRERRRASEGALSCSYSDFHTLISDFSVGGELQGQPGAAPAPREGPLPRQSLEEQQRYVESLRQEIQAEQSRAERDLEREQAHLRQQHAEVQQWIQQETRRLASLEEKATQEFGVQTDFFMSIPHQETQEDSVGPGEPRPATPSSKAVGARKKVVQEELLKHHSLRRAESRVRRKRLHYQLERIARKRHLLEAKRELQRLERIHPPGVDSPGSPELGSPPRATGRLPVLRRHSFSADLLSRLYPQHMPIFSHFLRRNKSGELAQVSVSGRKWVSDECLPRERSRSRSCTVSSSRSQGSRSGGRSSENLENTMPGEPPLAQPSRPRPERKALLPNRGLLFRANQNPGASQSLPGPAGQPIRNLKSGPPADKFGPQKALCKGVRGLPRGGRGLDILRKVFSRSVGPGIKSALASVFRKPPSGLQCGGRIPRPGDKISGRFRWRQTRNEPTGDSKISRSSVKVTVSCEELDQMTLSQAPGQRRWHSAETLMSQTCRWVERQQGLEGWVEVENEVEGEKEEGDEGSSDCDSMFSLDSLSSTYAKALAEQLRQEEMFHSEAESEDSQMSKDSLAAEDGGEQHTDRLGLSQTIIPTHTVVALHPHVGQNLTSKVLSRSEMDTTLKHPEMPAEAYWSQYGHPKARVNGETGTTAGTVTQKPPVTELKDTASESEKYGRNPILVSYSPRSLSSCSLREPETLLALTDAWSSTDAADSPRMHRDTPGHRTRMVFRAVNSSCSPSPTSVELSGSQSRSGSYSSVSTEGAHGTVEELRPEVSEGSLDTLDFPDSQFLSTAECLTMTVSQEPFCVKQFEAPSQIMGNVDSVGSRQIIEAEDLLQEPGSYADCENYNILSASQPTLSNEPETPQLSVLADASSERVPEIATDINVFSSGHQSKAILLPYPETEGERMREVFDIESVSHGSCEDTELCKEKKVSIKVKDTESCKVTNTKDMLLNSDNIQQKLETKEPDSQCAQSQQEALKLTSKNSRKRNQVNQDSFVGSLKIPKRSIERDLLTSCSPVRTITAVGPDNNNNGSDLEVRLSVLPSDKPRVPQSNCTQDGFRQNTAAKEAMAVPGTTSNGNERANEECKDASCDCKSGGVGGHKGILLEDGGVTLKREGERNEREDVESRGDKPQTDRKRRERENISLQPLRDRDSSKLDLRISEVVMEHMKMSLTDEVVSNSDVEMESESLPCHHLTSQQALVDYSPDVTANLASALLEKHLDHSEWVRKDTKTDQTVTSYRNIGEPSTLIKKYSHHAEEIHPFPLVGLDISDGSAEALKGNERDVTQTRTSHQSSDDVQLYQKEDQHVHVVSSSSLMFSSGDLNLNAGRIHQGQNSQPDMSICERVPIESGHQIQNTHDGFRTTLFPPAKDYLPTKYLTLDCQNIELVQTMNHGNDIRSPCHLHKPFTLQGGRFSGGDSTSAKDCSMPQEVLAQPKSTKRKNSTTLLIAVELSSDKSSTSRYSPEQQNTNQSNPNESVDIQGLCASPETLNPEINRNHLGHQRDVNIRQPLLAQSIYQETQFDNGSHIGVNVGPRDNQANMKDDQYRLGKWLTVGCSKDNLAVTLRQPAKDEEDSVTNRPPTESLVLTPMEKAHAGLASSPIIPQGRRDDNVNMLADSCGDYRSKEGDAETSAFKQSYSTGTNKKGKLKRSRRVQAQIIPSSSSDSTIKSSSDEEVKIRANRNRCLPTSRLKIGSHRNGQPDAVVSPQVVVASSKPNVTTSKETYRVSGRRGRESKVNVFQNEHGVTVKSFHVVEEEKRTSREKSVLASMEESEMLPCAPKLRDSPMHFASSDINPFVHQWQGEDADQRCYKTPAFGSAADLTCKSPLLNSVEKHITRCCSVDNGLNVQNSPFNSHLSTYANNKGLSSTLSSIEDFQEPTSHKSPLSPGSYGSCVTHQPPNMTEAVSNSSSNSVSGGLGTSLDQADKFTQVYSSEQESQTGRPQACGMMCDHGTQTTEDVGKRIRHRRSSTQVPQSTRVRDASRESNTWASLQNMSEHLSQLIHSTSDLLGNVQCMRNGDVLKRSLRNSPQHVHVSHCYSKDQTKRDRSTQTAVDIGIQTEKTPTPGLNKLSVYQYPSIDRSKSHEVNVIVKVIGSEVLSVSQENNSVCQDRVQTKTDDKIKSMPDLRTNDYPIDKQVICQQVGTSHKVLAMEPVVQCPNQPCSAVRTPLSGLKPELSPRRISIPELLSSSSQDASKENLKICANPEVSSVKQQEQQTVVYTDRASSPILTVGVRPGQRREQAGQLHKKHQTPKMHSENKDQMNNIKACWSTPCLNLLVREHRTSLSLTDRDETCGVDSIDGSISKPESVSLENVSELRHSSTKEMDECSSSSFADNESRCPVQELRGATFSNPSKLKSSCQSLRWSISSMSSNGITMPNHTPLPRQSGASRQEQSSLSTLDHLQSYKGRTTEFHHRDLEDPGEYHNSGYDPIPIGARTSQLQEDDLMSLAPSECNTDVLVNINPIGNPSPQPEHGLVPEDLPMHNKFTNWSGISHQPTDRRTSSTIKPAAYPPNNPEVRRRSQVKGDETESKHGTSLGPGNLGLRDRKSMEIERLRKEREQVMSTVHLNMNSHQLTVELTEAKLHYGLGETDTLLKMMSSGSREEPSAGPSKQQLYDRHRRSIEGWRQEREAQLQIHRRARSLSPSKHPRSPPQGDLTSSRVSALPSRRKDYLQQLRQEVVDSTRIPDPPQGECHYPSEIEQLLRDYGRAREEARTEIARARERLRERTEQEKRRLQQQTLSQVVKDDLRHRTRISSSTLCTGSSLSLSSGPTSGYNSGNTTHLKDGYRPTLTVQAPGVHEDVLRFRDRPPLAGSQGIRSQRAWLSVQDVRLEPGLLILDPPMSSPSSPTSLRQRTASFGSSSSISTGYQDITSCLLGKALAEVRLAAGGDTGNLVMGKATAGWRYQGTERGVQVYHRPSSSPSVHGFLGAAELDRPLASLWSLVRDPSKTHLLHLSVRSAWTRPLDGSTQLVYLVTDPSSCHLKQPRDFCCVSVEARQGDLCVLAMQSVFEESLPRPSMDMVRGEMLPSAWFLQPILRGSKEVVRVIFLLQVDLGSPSLPQRVLNMVARRQASAIAELDAACLL